jgi:hypothetical protein
MTLHVHSDIHAAASARLPPPPSLNFPLFCFIGIAPNSSLNRFTTPPPSSADPLLPTFCINQLKCTSKFVLRPLPSPPLRAAATHQPRRQRRWRRRQPKLHLALGSPCAAPLHPRRRDRNVHSRQDAERYLRDGPFGTLKKKRAEAPSGATTVNFPQMFLLTTDPQV